MNDACKTNFKVRYIKLIKEHTTKWSELINLKQENKKLLYLNWREEKAEMLSKVSKRVA